MTIDKKSYNLIIDNTHTYCAGIHETHTDGVLKIYLYALKTWVGSGATEPRNWEKYVKMVEKINNYISENNYEFILAGPTGTVIANNAEKLEEFRDVKRFALTKFTITHSLKEIPLKTIHNYIKAEHRLAKKQEQVDLIKGSLNANNISDEGLKQIKHILGM